MIYIFEDNKNSPLCKAFNSAYNPDVTKDFRFTEGCSFIIPEVVGLIGSEDEVYVYLDLVPDNPETRRVYIELCKLKDKFGKLIVFPILCREYLYLKALYGTQAVMDDKAVESCLKLDWWGDSPILNTDQDRKFCKNTEKLCKLTVLKALRDCANNKQRYRYLNSDCICTSDSDTCSTEISVNTKITDLLKAFTLIPSGSKLDCVDKASFEDCITVHRDLVNMYNRACDKLRELDTRRIKRNYKHVEYMW